MYTTVEATRRRGEKKKKERKGCSLIAFKNLSQTSSLAQPPVGRAVGTKRVVCAVRLVKR